jgi:AraC-like DNA-binding protein
MTVGNKLRRTPVTREPTIAANGVNSFMEFAISKGASRRSLVQRSGIDPAVLQDGDNRIPFSRYVALMRAGQELCDDPALALHFGEEVDCSEIILPVGGASNIRDAVTEGNRYAPLAVEVESVGTADRFGLVRDAGQLWLVDNRGNPNDFPELTESAFARMVCSTRRLMGDVKMIKAMRVTHAEPSYRAEYDRIFRVPVAFGSDTNGLQIDEALMSRFKFPSPSKYVTGVLHDHAEKLLVRLDNTQSTCGRIENLLVPILHTGDVTVDRVAGELGLSRQTLFRRLKAEGATFQQLLDQLRYKLALHHLTKDKASVQRTARLVGFSDATAFSRAFKRWTGLSPREYVGRSVPPA